MSLSPLTINDAYAILRKQGRRPKYGNRKTTVDGVQFDSAREAARYGELKLMLKCGEITELELQPKYSVFVNDVKVCTYIGDFRYRRVSDGAAAKPVCEDSKGMRTPLYQLKKKLVEALYGIEIMEV